MFWGAAVPKVITAIGPALSVVHVDSWVLTVLVPIPVRMLFARLATHRRRDKGGQKRKNPQTFVCGLSYFLAPRPGLEPGTCGLTDTFPTRLDARLHCFTQASKGRGRIKECTGKFILENCPSSLRGFKWCYIDTSVMNQPEMKCVSDAIQRRRTIA